MGAKPPDQLNLRRPTVKCDLCGRKFLNAQALKSHHQFLHLKPEVKRPPFKKRIDTKQLKKTVIPVNMLKRVVPPQPAKQVNKTDVKENTSIAGKKPFGVDRKAKFECPICAALFPVYFSAFRHIQKSHCVDVNGKEVAPNSPLLVKPIRQEFCVTCHKQIWSTDKHECTKPVIQQDQYKCLGCNQIFAGLVLFQHHVKGLHDDGSQNYFFPTKEEFTSWKKDLEDQTELNFVRLNTKKSKEVFHCSHQSPNTTAISHLCPSIITLNDYKTGVHVCYYKDHHGHALKSADLDKYSNRSISSFMQDSEEVKIAVDNDNELYLQFKNIISSIVSDASKVEVTTLKELLGKALEMTSILKSFDGEDRSLPVVSKSLTDAQISSNLETLKSKRKLSPVPKDVKKETKKTKKEGDEKLIENGVSLRARSSPALNKSVSFTKNLKKNNEAEKNEEAGQKLQALLQSPTSFNESYKNFVDQNFKTLPDTSTPKPKSNVRKKEVVKTKIGQFKVKPSSLSPKESSSNESLSKETKEQPVSPVTWKVKKDFKYEVKERENDCNILILKF